ncbi:MAG TPA: hypothetical protein VIT44_02320 [Cyclobacteriaceae bacterium]
MKGEVYKYLIYLFALPTIGFAWMFILRPLTEGAHDGGFLGMMFGLTVAQLIFSSWLTNLKWYFSIPFGLLLALVTIFISYWTIGTIRDIYNPIKDGRFFRDPDEQLENRLAWIFFIILGPISVILIEGLNKLTSRKIEKN